MSKGSQQKPKRVDDKEYRQAWDNMYSVSKYSLEGSVDLDISSLVKKRAIQATINAQALPKKGDN